MPASFSLLVPYPLRIRIHPWLRLFLLRSRYRRFTRWTYWLFVRCSAIDLPFLSSSINLFGKACDEIQMFPFGCRTACIGCAAVTRQTSLPSWLYSTRALFQPNGTKTLPLF